MTSNPPQSDTDSFTRLATQSLPAGLLSDTATLSDTVSGHGQSHRQDKMRQDLCPAYGSQSAVPLPTSPSTYRAFGQHHAQESPLPDYQQLQQLNLQLQLKVHKVRQLKQNVQAQAEDLEQECQRLQQQQQRLTLRTQDLEQQVQSLQLQLRQQQVLVLFADNKTTPDVRQIPAMAQKKMGRQIAMGDLVLMFDAIPSIPTLAIEAQPAQPAINPVVVTSSLVQTEPAHVREVGVGIGDGRIQVETPPQDALVGTGAVWGAGNKTDRAALVPPTSTSTSTTSTNQHSGDRPSQAHHRPTITPVTDPVPSQPIGQDLVITHRPPGDGPAPYHVTIRFLRPAVSETDLLLLARQTKSLAKLFYPPFNMATHVGRAATYFFNSRQEAFAFCMALRTRNDDGEMEGHYRLTDRDMEAAKSRGVKSVWLERGNLPRLVITMSDPKKRAQALAERAESVEWASHRKHDGGAKRVVAQDQTPSTNKRSANPFDILQEVESQGGYDEDDDLDQDFGVDQDNWTD